MNFDKKPVKNTDNIMEIKKQNPEFTQEQCLDKCHNMCIGDILPNLILQVPTQDPVEKLKLFRLASKIQDKMITAKSEITLDITQVNELYDFVGKVQNVNIITIAPILIYSEELKEKLKKLD